MSSAWQRSGGKRVTNGSPSVGRRPTGLSAPTASSGADAHSLCIEVHGDNAPAVNVAAAGSLFSFSLDSSVELPSPPSTAVAISEPVYAAPNPTMQRRSDTIGSIVDKPGRSRASSQEGSASLLAHQIVTSADDSRGSRHNTAEAEEKKHDTDGGSDDSDANKASRNAADSVVELPSARQKSASNPTTDTFKALSDASPNTAVWFVHDPCWYPCGIRVGTVCSRGLVAVFSGNTVSLTFGRHLIRSKPPSCPCRTTGSHSCTRASVVTAPAQCT
jgi:hypothetical protein